MITAGSATPAWGSQSLTLQRQSIGGHGPGGGALPPWCSLAPAPCSAPACPGQMLLAIGSGGHNRAVRSQHEPSQDPELPGDPAPFPAPFPAILTVERLRPAQDPSHHPSGLRGPGMSMLPHCAPTAPCPVLWGQESVPAHRTQPRDSWPHLRANRTINQALHPRQCLPPPHSGKRSPWRRCRSDAAETGGGRGLTPALAPTRVRPHRLFLRLKGIDHQ